MHTYNPHPISLTQSMSQITTFSTTLRGLIAFTSPFNPLTRLFQTRFLRGGGGGGGISAVSRPIAAKNLHACQSSDVYSIQMMRMSSLYDLSALEFRLCVSIARSR